MRLGGLAMLMSEQLGLLFEVSLATPADPVNRKSGGEMANSLRASAFNIISASAARRLRSVPYLLICFVVILILLVLLIMLDYPYQTRGCA